MKRYSLLFIFCFVFVTSYSQSLYNPVSKYADVDLKKDDTFLGMVMLADSSVVLINTNDDQEITFQRFDKELRLLKSTKTKVPGYVRAKYFSSIIQLKGKYYFSFSKKDRNDYLYSYSVLEFDPYSLQFTGILRKIIPFEQMAYGTIHDIPNMHLGYRNYTNTVNSYYKEIVVQSASPDSLNYLMAFSRADSASWKGNKLYRYKDLQVVSDSERVQFNIFDQNFKRQWSREITFRDKLQLEDYAVDNEGKLYVLAKLDSSAKRSFDSNYEIYVFRHDTLKPDTLCPTYCGRSMHNGKFFSPNGKELWITGTFSDKFFELGVFCSALHDTLPHYDERRGDMVKINKTKSDIYLREIRRTGNGKLKVIFEDYSLSTFGKKKEYEERTERGVINENFEDLRIVSINETGNIEWVTEVPKLQSDIKNAVSVYTFLPFKAVSGKDDVRLFYIDNKDNFGPQPSSWRTDYELGRHARMAGVYVSPSGNARKYNVGKIDDLGSLKSQFHFSGAYMYGANHQNHKNKLYKLKLD